MRHKVRVLKTSPRIKSSLQLNRQLPLPSQAAEKEVTALLKRQTKRQVQDRIRRAPKRVYKQLTQTMDPFAEEEIHNGLQPIQAQKTAVGKTRQAYGRVRKARRILGSSKAPRTVTSRKAGRKASAQTNVFSVIKTLRSRYTPSGTIKNLSGKGTTKATAISGHAAKFASRQLAKKIIAAVAANPKVMLIGALIGGILFLLLMLTNSMGGATTTSAGSYFMTDDENARQYKAEIEQLNSAFQQKITALSQSGGFDNVRVDYMNEDGTIHVNWVELFALLAVKYEQDLQITDEQRVYMKELFNYFNNIQTFTETYTVNVCRTDEKGKQTCTNESRRRLVIQVYSYDMEDVFEKSGFDNEQQEWARRLVTSGAIQEQFPDLATGGLDPGAGSLNPEELADLMNNLSGDISAARRKVVETAVSLEGRVGYFWGGRSGPGWNSRWGTPVLVTAPGNSKTGTYQPFGLDCSGFVDWAFKTAGLGNSLSGATSYQWTKSYAISADEMQPGDMIFKNIPGQGGVNHVGIFIGRDSGGKALYVHCQGSTGVIVNSYKGFKYPRRPLIFQGG